MANNLMPGAAAAAADIELDDVDFAWVKACDNPKLLKKAIKLLRPEPYPELLRAAEDRLRELEPSAFPAVVPEVFASRDDVESAVKDLAQWTSKIGAEDGKLKEVAKNKKRSTDAPVRGVDGSAKSSAAEKKPLLPEEAKTLAIHEKNKGNEFFHTHDYAEAVQSYTRSIVAFPHVAAVYANRALAYIKLQQFAEAELDCGTALTLDPKYVKAYWRRGTARQALNRLEEAIADYECGLKLEPENPALKKALSEAQEAVASKKKQAAPQPLTAKKPAVSGKKIVIEEVDEDDSDDEAPASQSKPNSAKAAPATAAASKPTPAAAPSARDTVLEKATALLQQGSQQNSKGQYEVAIASLTKAVETLFSSSSPLVSQDGKSREACLAQCYSQRALSQSQLGNHKSTLTDCEAALQALNSSGKDNKLTVETLLRKAFALEAMERPAAALSTLRQVLALDGSVQPALQALGRLAKTAKAQVAQEAEDGKTKGNKAVERGEYAEALEHYARALQLLRDHADTFRDDKLWQSVLCNRALCHLQLLNFDAAIEDCTAVIDKGFPNAKAFFRRGVARRSTGQLDAALKDLQRVIQLEPSATAQAELQLIQEGLSKKAADNVADVSSAAAEEKYGSGDIQTVSEGKSLEHKSSGESGAAKADKSLRYQLKEAPRTLEEFDVAWANLHKEQGGVYSLLQSMHPSALPKLFTAAGALSPEQLEAILLTIADKIVKENPVRAFNFLKSLAQTSRFDLNFMLTSELASDAAKRVFGALKGNALTDQHQLHELANKYSV